VEAALRRIEALDPALNAFIEVDAEKALAAADAVVPGDRAPFAGVPIAIKGNIGVEGYESNSGSRFLAGHRPDHSAYLVRRLREAGFVIVGITNLPEFAILPTTEPRHTGPTRNPWDPTRVPGGSGGGSAAAVSAGFAPWALGSDTGGSVKLPSSFCGNVGLRPTYGTVSRYGIVAFASSLDQVGPVTRNVRDNALLYRIISGLDEHDSTTVDVPPVVLPQDGDLKGVRIGVPRQLHEVVGIESGVKAAVDAAVAHAEGLGAELDTCELPLSVDYGLACYYLVAPSGAAGHHARDDGVRYGLRSDGADFREMVMRTRHDGFGDEPKRRIMLGTYALSSGYYDAYYASAQKVRTLIRREHDALFERFDLLLSPTCATTAFPIGEKAADPLAMYLTDLLTIPSNMAGLPSISLPCGLSEGLPVGLQLIGPQFSENTIYRVAHALELAIGFDPVPERLR
jgi:aspartyl-tRNA(Asn)/glutamyl-tRNA(Gln) amidotransferase subunit A